MNTPKTVITFAVGFFAAVLLMLARSQTIKTPVILPPPSAGAKVMESAVYDQHIEVVLRMDHPNNNTNSWFPEKGTSMKVIKD